MPTAAIGGGDAGKHLLDVCTTAGPRGLATLLTGHLPTHGWGARNRTLNNRTRICCVASYTTPQSGALRIPSRRNVRHRALARESVERPKADDLREGNARGFLGMQAQILAARYDR